MISIGAKANIQSTLVSRLASKVYGYVMPDDIPENELAPFGTYHTDSHLYDKCLAMFIGKVVADGNVNKVELTDMYTKGSVFTTRYGDLTCIPLKCTYSQLEPISTKPESLTSPLEMSLGLSTFSFPANTKHRIEYEYPEGCTFTGINLYTNYLSGITLEYFDGSDWVLVGTLSANGITEFEQHITATKWRINFRPSIATSTANTPSRATLILSEDSEPVMPADSVVNHVLIASSHIDCPWVDEYPAIAFSAKFLDGDDYDVSNLVLDTSVFEYGKDLRFRKLEFEIGEFGNGKI